MADEIKNVNVDVKPEAKTEEATEPMKPKRGGNRKKKADTASATLEVSNSVYDQILEETRITNSILKDLVGTIVSIADGISATNKEYNDKAINLLNEQIERQKPIIDHQLESLNANHDDLVTQINKSFEKVHSDIVNIDARVKENEKRIENISVIVHGILVKPKKKKKNKKL